MKIHLFGMEGNQWAIDEDYRAFENALSCFTKLVSLENAEIIHAVWWERFLTVDPRLLQDRFVVCNMDNPPFHYLKNELFHRIFPLVDFWIARSKESYDQLVSLGWKGAYVPYVVDMQIFNPQVLSSEVAKELRGKWNIPDGKYLIGNFYRDTELSDLVSPKRQKAPEVIAEMAKILCGNDDRFHFILAGPRRQFILKKFQEYNVPHTYIGQTDFLGDDYEVNRLNRPELAKLYGLIDCYLTCSRWEGGPQSILESAACGTKIISNHIGLAEDILCKESLFDRPMEAVNLLREDAFRKTLDQTVEPQYQSILRNHTFEGLADQIQKIYESGAISFEKRSREKGFWIRPLQRPKLKGFKKLFKRATRIGIWISFGTEELAQKLEGTLSKHQQFVDEDRDFKPDCPWILWGLNSLDSWSEKPAKGRGMVFLDHSDFSRLQKSSKRLIRFKHLLEIHPETLVCLPSCESLLQLKSMGVAILSPSVTHGLVLRKSSTFETTRDFSGVILNDKIEEVDQAVFALRKSVPLLAPQTPLFEEVVGHGGEFYRNGEELSPKTKEMNANIDFYRNSTWILSEDEVIEKLGRLVERHWIQ